MGTGLQYPQVEDPFQLSKFLAACIILFQTLGKAQIACLLCTQEEMIQVEVMDVQQQVCGKQAATYYKMSIIICRWVAMTVDSLPLLLPQQRHMEELQIYANLNKLKCDDIFTPVFLLEN